MSPISIPRARRSATRSRSRIPPGCSAGCIDAIEYRGFSQEAVEDLAKYAGVPVYNGLTDEYHPTQMLADVMTMREYSDRPVHEIKYAYVGDTRSNMGHSLMIVGCLMGMDVRICGPKSLWPSDDYVKTAREPREEIRRQADHHRGSGGWPSRAPISSIPMSGSPWARPRRSGPSASSCSSPTR